MKLIQHSLAIMLALFISMTAWANEEGPRTVIENTVNQIIEALNVREDKNILTDKDRDAIRQVIEGRFDYRTMARKSLGSKSWKKLSAEKQSHFTDIFRELLERSYGNRLAEYKDQKVVFADAQVKQKKKRVIAVVRSKVIDGTRETPVVYRMHQTDTGWQVYDIKIEGTSMVRTKYEEYKSVLKKDGYDHLLKALEDQLARLKAKDAS
jgi:phospholipid transport system substrate-binding protein